MSNLAYNRLWQNEVPANPGNYQLDLIPEKQIDTCEFSERRTGEVCTCPGCGEEAHEWEYLGEDCEWHFHSWHCPDCAIYYDESLTPYSQEQS